MWKKETSDKQHCHYRFNASDIWNNTTLFECWTFSGRAWKLASLNSKRSYGSKASSLQPKHPQRLAVDKCSSFIFSWLWTHLTSLDASKKCKSPLGVCILSSLVPATTWISICRNWQRTRDQQILEIVGIIFTDSTALSEYCLEYWCIVESLECRFRHSVFAWGNSTIGGSAVYIRPSHSNCVTTKHKRETEGKEGKDQICVPYIRQIGVPVMNQICVLSWSRLHKVEHWPYHNNAIYQMSF